MSKDEKLLRLEQRMVLDVIRMTSLFCPLCCFLWYPCVVWIQMIHQEGDEKMRQEHKFFMIFLHFLIHMGVSIFFGINCKIFHAK